MTDRTMDQFMLQQALAPAACPFVFVCLTILLHPVWHYVSSGSGGVALTILMFLSGVVLGYIVPRFASRGLELARWAWIVPSLVLLLFFVTEAKASGIPLTLAGFFNPGEAGSEALLYVLITFPTASAYCYSIGAAIRYSRRNRGAAGK